MNTRNTLIPIRIIACLAIVGLSIGRYMTTASKAEPTRGPLALNFATDNTKDESALPDVEPPVAPDITKYQEPTKVAASENVTVAQQPVPTEASPGPGERSDEAGPSKVSLSTHVLGPGLFSAGTFDKQDGYTNKSTVELIGMVSVAAQAKCPLTRQADGPIGDFTGYTAGDDTAGGWGSDAHGRGGNLFLPGGGERDEPHAGFGAHANKFITFDLDAVRRKHFAGRAGHLRLTGSVGVNGAPGVPPEAAIQGGVWVDGVRRESSPHLIRDDVPYEFIVYINADSRWLTLAMLNGPDATRSDDVAFRDIDLALVDGELPPKLEKLEPTQMTEAEAEPTRGPLASNFATDNTKDESALPDVETAKEAVPKPKPVERSDEAGPSKVEFVRRADQQWQLLRNGNPYFVKGVGGDKHLAAAAHFGANSIRTWGIGNNTADLLDNAHEHGLTVSLGYWMGHARHGFKYHDPAVVKRQQDDVIAAVKKHKDHPALLFWGVGNEVETGHSEDDKLWQAINAAAKAIKEIDPHHPTMIVIAELGANNINVEQIRRHCPDIDVVGLNAYDSVYTIVERYRKAKLDKPCILTEYGPPLQPRDQFGLAKEPTSTEKAEIYRTIYQQGIARHSSFCFGGYSFVWGKKIEKTDTYFGQWLVTGERLAGAEVFHELFGGRPPANWCPRIKSFDVTPSEHVSFAGEPLKVSVVASDRDDDDLSYRFELKRELRATVGGDHIDSNKNLFQAIKHSAPNSNEAIITPPGLGAYRVYAYVFDGEGNAATATTTIAIKRKVKLVEAKPLTLPFSLYKDRQPSQPYSPSGYMGDKSGQIKMNFDYRQQPKSGSSCLQIRAPAGAWSGVNWQHPAGDWGGRAGGFDLSGARRLSFWARGANGGEDITFALGGIGPSETYFDTAKGNVKVKLTKEWKQYYISLDGKDLTRIKTPFHWSSYHGAKVIEFFVDDIRFQN